ncbi:ABC transporter substrate-binding protein [Nonomuraea longicatena]|uniref:Fe/B12 periplasmic-binding domain-containing protein n=1 Tax=Nonomuraea longicatena TaxID=83682 RepID=A0ABN1Q8P6_9ACTN
MTTEDRGHETDHRNALEPVKRRLVPLVLAAPLLLAACGTTTTTGSAPPTPTVTITAANGEVTVPVTDTGIWALDYQTAINLLALGVVPSHAGRYTYDPDPYVKAAYALLERAGVKLVEPGKAELVAAAEPELVVGRPNMGNDEIVPRLGGIAPVVTLPGLPVLEKELGTLGAITGRGDRASALAARLERKLSDLAGRVKSSEFAGDSVSVLSACGEDGYCVYGDARGFGRSSATSAWFGPRHRRRKATSGATRPSRRRTWSSSRPTSSSP